ncbi:unnamed protein product [Schistocephalus solidus]|uniref:Cyclic nucleotide-binding domain-containing protein n=1 Tax=Schistocephalus solidus TaxID=70667 RepID=A0A183SNI6_SCHSO|nr:unnamed protein product [Schistocephalus solidus]
MSSFIAPCGTSTPSILQVSAFRLILLLPSAGSTLIEEIEGNSGQERSMRVFLEIGRVVVSNRGVRFSDSAHYFLEVGQVDVT